MPQIAWSEPPKEKEEKKPSGIKWEEQESDGLGMGTAFMAGINKGLFHLTGGSMFEYLLDYESPERPKKPHGMDLNAGRNTLNLHGVQKGFDWVKDFTGVTYEAKNSGERIAQRAGEDLSIGTSTAIMTIATGGSTAIAPMTAKIGEKVVSSILQSFRTSPIAMSIYEMLGMAGSGAAMETVKEQGGGPVAQTAAGVAGAVTPLAPKMAWTALSHTVPMLFKKAFDSSSSKAVQEVAKALKTGIGDMSDLVKSNQIFANINAKKLPSVAEASGDPGLIARQKSIEAESSGSELDSYVKRHRDVVSGIEAGAKTVAPESTIKDAEIVIDAATVRLNRTRDTLKAKGSEVNSELSITGRNLPEATDRIAAGKALKELRTSIRNEVSDSFKKEADDLGLNNVGTEFEATALRDELRGEFFNPQSKYARNSKSRILKRVDRTPEEVDAAGKSTGQIKMTWEDVRVVREELNEEISVLLASGHRKKASELIKAKDIVDNFVDTHAPNGVDGKAWADFRARYKTDFIDRFEKGASYKVSGSNRRGEYFTNEEMVADAFLLNETTVADFFNLYGSQANEAVPLLRTAILDRARKASVVDGVVNEKALGRFIESGPLSKILREFPLIRQELTNVRTATQALSLRAGVLNSRAAQVEASGLRRVMSLSGDPDEMIMAALKDPKMMRGLVRASERAGWGRRPVASLVWEKAELTFSEDGVPTPDSLLRFIKSNRQSLNEVFSKKYADRLRNIYEALEISSRVGAPKGKVEPYGAADKLRETTGISVPQLASRTYAYSAGLIGKRHMVFESAMRFFGKFTGRRAKALMKEALYDENIARDIDLMIQSPSLSRQKDFDALTEARLNAALFNMGLGNITDE